MNTKMILTDLDHTLLRSDGSVSEHTKQILKKCQDCGILVVIATARYWIGAERYIEEIRPDYEITTDGTLIHQRGKQIYSCTIELNDANQNRNNCGGRPSDFLEQPAYIGIRKIT